MADVEALRAHVCERYGIRVTETLALDEGVVLMRRNDGPDWVARVFSAERPLSDVDGDAEILNWLREQGYPAERCADQQPVSVLDGAPVLVTEAVAAVPPQLRRQAVKDSGGIVGLGALLARLTQLDVPAGAPSRPGGAWHHLARGLPGAELEAAAEMLEATEQRAAARELGYFTTLTDEFDSLDDGAGLPQTFIHPDFVLRNVVATAEPAMVLVDWAGAGVGPRIWSLAFLLWAEAAKDPRRAALALRGFRQHAELEPEEVKRLAPILRARPLIFTIWRLHNASIGAAAAVEEVRETRQLADTIAAAVSARLSS